MSPEERRDNFTALELLGTDFSALPVLIYSKFALIKVTEDFYLFLSSEWFVSLLSKETLKASLYFDKSIECLYYQLTATRPLTYLRISPDWEVVETSRLFIERTFKSLHDRHRNGTLNLISLFDEIKEN